MLEDIARSERGLTALGELDCVSYGGGVLSLAAGEKTCKVTHLRAAWGSTESGPMIQLDLPSEDWPYLGIDAKSWGVEWKPTGSQSEAGGEIQQFEPIVRCSTESEKYNSVWKVFPNRDTWETGDLWKPHPTKKNVWKFAGRTDDLIPLASGLKFYPKGYEEALIAHHPFVQNALLFGERHQQTVLLLELRQYRDNVDVRYDIWQTVEGINNDMPSHAHVAKTHIIFARPDKPFVRAAKETVLRTPTIKQYQEKIEEVYRVHGPSRQRQLRTETFSREVTHSGPPPATVEPLKCQYISRSYF